MVNAVEKEEPSWKTCFASLMQSCMHLVCISTKTCILSASPQNWDDKNNIVRKNKQKEIIKIFLYCKTHKECKEEDLCFHLAYRKPHDNVTFPTSNKTTVFFSASGARGQ